MIYFFNPTDQITCRVKIVLRALQNLGIERLSLFKNGGNKPISEFLDPNDREMQIFTKYICPERFPG